ncbi:MAG TPA: sigma-70 family RNA polymerase sigma factor [Ktedonobacterales bacterium]
MDQRNISGAEPLQTGMHDEWALGGAPGIHGAESAALPALDGTARPLAPAPSDAGLVARAREGDQEAFSALVRLHQRQVYALALRMLRNSEDAVEATQEVFLAAWQGLAGFRGDARFATWLYRIAYNHCLKVAERQRRDATVRAELAAESARAWSAEGALSARIASDAERAMRERVRGEIANLPPKYRAVLVLRHLNELSYEEMAEVMRVPIGTVKTQLFRARALLKERLEALGRFRDEGISRAGELRAEIEAGLRGILERGRESHAEGEL